jgi:hypothetical protein
MKTQIWVIVFLFLLSIQVQGESFRATIAGTNRVSLADPDGFTVPLSYISSSIIQLEGDTRFFRALQLELTAPQSYLSYRGSLAVELYGELNVVPMIGVTDVEGRRLGFDPLPAKIQSIYQIPLKNGHGLRTSPYATVLTGVVRETSFPLIFRLMPVIKGITDEMERFIFNLNVKPILSDEGAMRINFRYPGNLAGRPLTVMVDDEVMENPGEERLFKEGEHKLVIFSEYYRNHSSRFVVERAKILDLTVELLDPTPLLVFEYPERTRIYLDNVLIVNPGISRPLEPGFHEVRFELSDYTITRPLIVEKGKTYRLALSIDLNITESD